MKIRFETLLKEGKIKAVQSSPKEVNEILSLAERDIKMAEFVATQNLDWAFTIAYNAALQASRAYMYHKGYRPSAQHGHKNTFEFMKIALSEEHKNIIGFFDRMRSKRNIAIYDMTGLITETEVKELIEKSKGYVRTITKMIRG